jgi:hypothetical protein
MRWLYASLLILFVSNTCAAETPLTLKQIEFKLWFGQQREGPRDTLYVLFGCCYMLNAPIAKEAPPVIAQWIAAHPDAEVTVVDRAAMFADEKRDGSASFAYVWIQDGDENLNLTLVRQGMVPAGVMTDGAAYLSTVRDLDQNSRTYPKRMVTDVEYEAFFERALAAEALAIKEGKGIWSDRYKEDREIWGLE